MLSIVLLLGACGFQPRGESARPAASISPLFITGLPQHHLLVRELRRQLQISGVSLAAEQDQAATILHLGRPDRKRSVFSVNANNKAVEYEIRHSLRYSIEHPPGNMLRKHQQLTSAYIIYNPGGQLLGRTREAEQRSQDAYHELAQRLVNQLGRFR